MGRPAIVLAVFAFVLTATPLVHAPAPAAEEKAAALLTVAEVYFAAGNYAGAEKYILESLATAPPQSAIRRRAVALLTETLVKASQRTQRGEMANRRKHEVLLQEARRLIAEGETGAASSVIMKVLDATEDAAIIDQADRTLGDARPGVGTLLAGLWPAVLSLIASIVRTVLLTVLLGLSVYGLLALGRWIVGARQGADWKVQPIVDNSGLGLGGLVAASAHRWLEVVRGVPVTAGLLSFGRAIDIAPWVKVVLANRGEEERVLEAMSLQVGGIDLGAVSKLLLEARRYLTAVGRRVEGIAFVSSNQVVVRLTKRREPGRVDIVTGMCEIAQGKDAAVVAAEAAVYKMYYLIATEGATPSDAEAADKLRAGVSLLRQFTSGGDPKALDQAYVTFRTVRGESPSLEEAHLYEGIALDLLERHDEAVSRFGYLAKRASQPALRDKAKYNEAIARLRKYEPEELEKAITTLKGLIQTEPTPLSSLARAAMANAIAHKPIFWQHLAFGSDVRDDAEVRRRKQDGRPTVEGWVREVEAITGVLGANDTRGANWDEPTRRQLSWAIANARGNAYLNYAKSFLHAPHVSDSEGIDRADYLEKARVAFQECDNILPAGVETLTNLATVLLTLARTEEARSYAQQAIDLNPHYEYAYYRLAQSWEDDERTDKVVQVLTSFRKPPRIPGFQEMFRKYYVKPASE